MRDTMKKGFANGSFGVGDAVHKQGGFCGRRCVVLYCMGFRTYGSARELT
jgi:hypothetical protein